MLYKGDKGVNDATCPPESDPAEAQGQSVSSLPCEQYSDQKAHLVIKENSTCILKCVLYENYLYLEEELEAASIYEWLY